MDHKFGSWLIYGWGLSVNYGHGIEGILNEDLKIRKKIKINIKRYLIGGSGDLELDSEWVILIPTV